MKDENIQEAILNSSWNTRQQDVMDEQMTNFYPAIIIADLNNPKSMIGARQVIDSIMSTDSELTPSILPATVPATLDYWLRNSRMGFGMDRSWWRYPPAGEVRRDLKSGLTLTGYQAKDQLKVFSAAISHYRAWEQLSLFDGGFVFEHDAVITKKISANGMELAPRGIVGLNDPRGSTRKSMLYHQRTVLEDGPFGSVKTKHDYGGYAYRIGSVPWVDDDKTVPQGLAGNSAYFISGKSCRKMLGLVEEHGVWPNDALMCRQLIKCNQVFPYITKLQRIESTTTG